MVNRKELVLNKRYKLVLKGNVDEFIKNSREGIVKSESSESSEDYELSIKRHNNQRTCCDERAHYLLISIKHITTKLAKAKKELRVLKIVKEL